MTEALLSDKANHELDEEGAYPSYSDDYTWVMHILEQPHPTAVLPTAVLMIEHRAFFNRLFGACVGLSCFTLPLCCWPYLFPFVQVRSAKNMIAA